MLSLSILRIERRAFNLLKPFIIGFDKSGRRFAARFCRRKYVCQGDPAIFSTEFKAFCCRFFKVGGVKYQKEDVLIFGFTSIIWEHFVNFLTKGKQRLNLENGIMIHGGGWKKLDQLAVDDSIFKNTLADICGIKKVHNYYGMVEQTGSIFMECENGYLHSSIFSDILVRGAELDVKSYNHRGSFQLCSLLPLSYPGHVLLTEDIGEIFGQDDCSCGRLGKYFRVYGRTTGADTRGCSDTYESI